MVVFIFFFKQKTAYERRISDWSSDVCSSDLRDFETTAHGRAVDRGDHGLVEIEAAGEAGEPGQGRRKTLAAGHRRGREFQVVAGAERTLAGAGDDGHPQIGRASCRERVCQYV